MTEMAWDFGRGTFCFRVNTLIQVTHLSYQQVPYTGGLLLPGMWVFGQEEAIFRNTPLCSSDCRQTDGQFCVNLTHAKAIWEEGFLMEEITS